MNKGLNVVLSGMTLVLLSCGTGYGDWGGLAISGKVGTLGLGGELTTGIASNINARIGMNILDYDTDFEVDDVDYDVEFDFSSFSALLDCYVFGGSFRVSGGIVSMDHELALNGSPTSSVEIGDTTYQPNEIGTLSGSLETDDLAPYIGIGWGDPLDPNKKWGFYSDLGVVFGSSPDVRLAATGPGGAGGAGGLAVDLTKEENEIQDEFDAFKLYPVISIGLFFRF